MKHLGIIVLSLGFVACGEVKSSGSESYQSENASTLTQFVLDSVDGSAVALNDSAILLLNPSEVYIEDTLSCQGLISVNADGNTLSAARSVSRGCQIDYLITSHQLKLVEALKSEPVPYTLDGEAMVVELDGAEYRFIPAPN